MDIQRECPRSRGNSAQLLDVEEEVTAIPFIETDRSLFHVAIWWSYFAVSKRVKATFVR